MEPIALPRPRDEDFQSSPTTILPRTFGDNAGAYLRLVANPILGFYTLAAMIFAFFRAMKLAEGMAFTVVEVVAFALFGRVALPRLFHYHCLDCRATGRLSRWRLHVCPASAARWREGRPRRFRGPSPAAQVVLWLVPSLFVAIAVHVLCEALR